MSEIDQGDETLIFVNIFFLQPARHSKLEKADILEMTVKHLQNLQRRQMALSIAADPLVVTKYRAGFNECAQEVSRYVNSVDEMDSAVKHRLLNHLATCITGLGGGMFAGSAAGTALVTSNARGVPPCAVAFDGAVTRLPPPTTAITTTLGRGPGTLVCSPNEASVPDPCAAVAPPSVSMMPHRLSNGQLTMVLKPNNQVAAPNWRLSNAADSMASVLRNGGLSPVAGCAASPSLEAHPEACSGPVWMSPDSTTSSGMRAASSPVGTRRDICTATTTTTVSPPPPSPPRSPCDSLRVMNRPRSGAACYSENAPALKEQSPSPSSMLSSMDVAEVHERRSASFLPRSVIYRQCYERDVVVVQCRQECCEELVEPVNLSKDAGDKMWRPW